MTGLVLPSARPQGALPRPRRVPERRPIQVHTAGDGEPPRPPATTEAPDARRLAQAQVSERDETVVIEFWVDPSRGPLRLRRLLVAETFAHPAVRPDRSALVSVPIGDSALLGEVGARLAMAHTRACGSTCLIEGRVRG